MSSLKSLSLARNYLNGSLPNQDFASLSNLEILDLSSNSLSGIIPSSIRLMSHLKFLSWPEITSMVLYKIKVCALLSGGGHAEKVAVPAGQVLPVPSGVSLKDAAGIPEVACTVWSTVLMMSRLSAGETFLVHGGSIGIGTIYSNSEILRSKGICYSRNEEKLAVCKDH
ncbi:hypothetical protein AAG906_013211 [Vitis piasezkii]